MAVTFTQAAQRIPQELLRGIGLGIATADEFTSLLNVENTSATKIDWNVEASIGTAQIVEHGGAISESAATTNLSGAYLEHFVDEVKIPDGLSENDVVFQTVSKAKALGRKLASEIATGTGVHSTPSIYGLETFAVASQTEEVAGALTLTALDKAADLVKEGKENIVFVMNSALRRKLYTLLRAANGATMIEYQKKMVPSVNGIPILVNDFIPSDEGTGTQSSIYCVSMVPQVTQLYMKGGTLDSESLDGVIQMTSSFPTAGYASKTRRFSFDSAFVIRSPLAISRLSEVTTE